MTDLAEPDPCPCAFAYHLPGSAARLWVRPDGLVYCRGCGRCLHPIPFASYLADMAAHLRRVSDAARGGRPAFTKYRGRR